jgi:hypothetical protein
MQRIQDQSHPRQKITEDSISVQLGMEVGDLNYVRGIGRRIGLPG